MMDTKHHGDRGEGFRRKYEWQSNRKRIYWKMPLPLCAVVFMDPLKAIPGKKPMQLLASVEVDLRMCQRYCFQLNLPPPPPPQYVRTKIPSPYF
jgi:hypothetical protein